MKSREHSRRFRGSMQNHQNNERPMGPCPLKSKSRTRTILDRLSPEHILLNHISHENFLNNSRIYFFKDLTQVNFAAKAVCFVKQREDKHERGNSRPIEPWPSTIQTEVHPVLRETAPYVILTNNHPIRVRTVEIKRPDRSSGRWNSEKDKLYQEGSSSLYSRNLRIDFISCRERSTN